MTGYGRGAAEQGDRRVAIEIRSVNHRFMDLKLRGVSLDAALEDKLMARVRDRVSRGSLSVTLRVEGTTSAPSMRVDQDAARRLYVELVKLASALDIEPRVSLDLLCNQTGVVVAADSDRAPEDIADIACQAVDHALDDLLAMRAAEGETLARDLAGRMERLGRLTSELGQQASIAPDEAQRRLRERVGRLLSGGQVVIDEGRLAQEVALLADRMDVTEELVRVRSHIAQLLDLMALGTEAVGRRMDFLVQELGREYNTVASKSQSAVIARLVVEAKAELEKVREQIQNIE